MLFPPLYDHTISLKFKIVLHIFWDASKIMPINLNILEILRLIELNLHMHHWLGNSKGNIVKGICVRVEKSVNQN